MNLSWREKCIKISITHKDELDGDVMAEYAQTLFLSGGRKFNNDIDEIINSS